MKNKTKKRLALVCAISCLFVAATGCGSADSSNSTADDSKTSAANESEKQDVLTSDWKEMKFLWNDVACQMPLSYEDIVAAGGELEDPEEILNPYSEGTSYSSTQDIIGNNYDLPYYEVCIYNEGSKEKKITDSDCKAESFRVDILDGDELKSTYPEIIFTGGITWGSTVEEIQAAFGEESNIESQEDFYRLSYSDPDYVNRGISMTVSKEFGLVEFTIQAIS